ncbi:MAG: ABC transporter ATP-binding protein [Methylophilaceae bacterium]|nr:ABC transporter ATP-binding protein [Methylophilaceae bacterium]MDG1820356.1 ABC transporter ATP-binding protein [Methylophilaceae bacterium]
MMTQEATNSMTVPALAAHHISKSFGEGEQAIHILQDLDLIVQSGESVAIIGSSGSGKSTLLGILAGLDLPSRGSVTIEGQTFSGLDEDARAAMRGRRMGFIFQSFQLLPNLTALENVMIPLQLANRADAKSVALTALDKVGLSARVKHYPKQLSGGEQQRVAIARAFALEPAILFADEPTGNLDQATGRQIVDLLFKFNAQSSTTLILVTHDHLLAQQCAKTYQLQQGVLTSPDFA